jgi:neutral ceramidase
MATLYAGAARSLINPPLGARTMGFSSRVGFIESVESDLSISAVVLTDGQSKVAILALDICIMPFDMCHALRRRIGEAIGTPASHVMLNFNHTHSAPAYPGWLPEEPQQAALLQDYAGLVLARATESAVAADRASQPARVAAGWGQSHFGVQRREKREDGLVFLGEVPDGETDPAVGVVRVDDLHGKAIATLFSYGCHTVVVGPHDLSASPDYPGAARSLVEQANGGLSLFLQACGGDIMPIGGMGFETDCSDSKNRIGAMLGAEVVKTAAGLRTHVKRGERTTLGSVSTITLWPWVPVSGETCTYLGAVSETLRLDFMDYPTLADAEQLRDEQHQRLRAAYTAEDERQIAVGLRWADWGDKLVDAIKTGRRTLPVEVQAIRINDIVLVGLSVEAFAGTGMTIKSRSAFKHMQVLAYTNGVQCYLPRAGDYPPGGWDIHARYGVPDMIFQSYSLPTAIRPESETRVVDKALDLVSKLT